MEKIVFCDLDGTLLDENNNIDNYSLEMVREYISKGGKLVIATGRLDHDIKAVEERFGIKSEYRISQNGAVIIDKNNKILLNNTIDNKIVKDVARYMKEIPLRVEASNLTNRYFPSKRAEGEVSEFVDSSIVDSNYIDKVGDEINPNIFLIFGDEERFNPIKEYLTNRYSEYINVVMTSPSSLEIFNKNSSKGEAIKFILEKENIKSSDVSAIGDSENDLSMFKVTKNSVAMSHSNERILKEAMISVETVGDYIRTILEGEV